MSDSEFLPVWKKYPGVAEKMIKAQLPKSRAVRMDADINIDREVCA
ncbi:MAG: hypothetical protein V2B19_30830 [Pseudomonadota bacterium]